METMLTAQSFQPTVRKDEFYALLGLPTPKARCWVIPDNSNAMSQRLFLIRVSAYFLRFSVRSLRFASYSRGSDCPSWVPDWTSMDSRVIKALGREGSLLKSYGDWPDRFTTAFRAAGVPSRQNRGI